MANLTKQSVSAVKWSAIGNIANYGLQLGAQIVLARLLGPEIYGLFALGRLVLAFTNMIANFGLAWGLVQAQHLSEKDIRFVTTWQLISGATATICLFLLAPALASFFNEPRLEPIVRWLSLACLISAATAPASNLLRRKLDFKSINIIEVISYIIGYIVIGIPLAISGAGIWALVTAWLTQSLCAFLLSTLRYPHSFKPLFWYDGAKTMTGVGYTVFATNICNWLLNNLDRTLLGRFLNAETVGLYTVGYNLANMPNSLFLGALQPAFLAAGARIQAEPDRLRSIYLSVIASVCILIFPIFVLFAIIAQDIVGLVYGTRWVTSGIVLTILALSMPAYVTWGLSTPILWNTGKKHWESLLQLPILLVSSFFFIMLANRGAIIVALVAACTLLARAVVITTAACRQLRIYPRDLRGFIVRGIALACFTAAATFSGCELGRMAGSALPPVLDAMAKMLGIEIGRIANAPHFYALAGGLLLGGTVLLGMPLLYPRILGASVIQMLGRFSPPLVALLEQRLRSNASRVYAKLGVVFIGGVLMAGTLFFSSHLWMTAIELLEHFVHTVFAVLSDVK